MKFSLFQNDKSTIKDELLLLAFIVVCLAIGIPLFAVAPSFWIVDSMITKGFGLVLIITGAMFTPGFIYRLMNNDKHHGE